MSIADIEGLDLTKLTPFEKRKFVPENADLTDKEQVIELCHQLLQRKTASQAELEAWLKDRSEFEAVLDQEASVLYIQMTCQTDDAKRAEAYKHFIETVVPAIRPLMDQLNHKYLEERKQFPLDYNRYQIFDRSIQSDIELFREENVPLQTKVDLLSQEYQTLCGAMTVSFQGEEKTLPQMSKYLLETDRQLREAAWRATAERRLQDKDKLDEIFDRMLVLRNEIAQNAGCLSFIEYQFKAYHRFDYTPQECKTYHETVERVGVPLLQSIYEQRKKDMGLRALKPWDLSVDPKGLPPLKPFNQVEELILGVLEMFKRTDPELGRQFQEMVDLRLLDLASRKGKAPGGYQNTLSEVRKPFIFMNAVGIDDDVRTLLHEGGHAFHALASADQSLYSYRHAPMEFCEVASMAMELLGGEQIGVFYNEADANRSKQGHFEDVIEVLVWVATIDAFQFWIYEHPQQTRAERNQAWLEIRQRFSIDCVDWSGLENIHASLWHRQLHIFEVPFYYIEYGIAQIGALQLWQRARRNLPEALRLYRKGLSLGGSRPLPEIFQTAGIRFDFSEKTIAPLIEEVRRELAKN